MKSSKTSSRLILIIIICCSIKMNFCYSQNFQKLESRDSVNFHFEDLKEFKNTVKNIRIIGLGESNHAMGTTFLMRTKLVKFLIDSLGFNTIAFESGIYDLHVINERLKLGKIDELDFFDGLFPMWKCHEFLELLEYINQNDKKKQINLIGIDNQFLKLSKKYLKCDMQTLEDSLRKYSPSFCLSDEFYKILDMEIKYSNYFKKFNPSDTVTFTKHINKIDSILAINNLDNNNYYTFWSRVNYNLRTDFIRRFHSDRLRDSIMAENLTYYANNNPEAKIIVIAASYHLMYNVQSIANKAYWNKLTIGTKLKEKFGNDYYFLAFTPFFGRSGTEKGLFSFKIKPAQLGSIEYLMSSLSDNSDFGLFCLRDNRNRIFLDNQFINEARILGTKVQSMDVKNVCDGLFFIKEMKGVKYL